MIGAGLAFAVGGWLLLQLPALPPPWAWGAAVALALVLRRLSPQMARWLCALLLGAALSAVCAAALLERSLAPEQVGQRVTVSGVIEGIPSSKADRTVFTLRLLDVEGPLASPLRARRLRASWYRPAGPLPAAGERWRFVLTLREAHTPGNPGGFDYRRWLFQQRVDALAAVVNEPLPERLASASAWSLDSWRAALAARLAALPSAGAELGLVQALTLGIGEQVSEAQRQTLRDTGTAHLLAISGLHIGLVASTAFALAVLLWRWFSPLQARLARRPFALGAGLLAAAGYALCAGFALPTQRALIMLLVVAVAGLTQRSIAPASAWVIALVLVLLLDPLATLSVGFWLSFGTVAALLYLHQGRLQASHPLRQATGVHAQLGIMLLPLTAWFFHSGALIAPLANLVAVPVVSLLVVPLALLTLALCTPLPALANLTLLLCQWLLGHLIDLLQMMLAPSISSVPLSLPGGELFALALLGTLVLLAPRDTGIRRYALPLLLPALWFNAIPRTVEGVEVHVLDVGQGLAVLVFTREHTLLYDTGDYRSAGVSQLESVILPFLRHHGRQRIDTVVISHSDRDHAAGADDLHRLFRSIRWYASQPDQLKVPAVTRCAAGNSWQVDDVQFAFLHPAAHDRMSDNDGSCVLLIHHGSSRILLTGDIERRAEGLLTARTGALPVTLMIAPHHGSRSSSSATLIDTFSPRHVVFPAGRNNRHGFPHPEVRLRYTLRGSKTWVTGIDGALGFRFSHQGLREPPSAWWRSQRRIWHRSGE